METMGTVRNRMETGPPVKFGVGLRGEGAWGPRRFSAVTKI